MYIYCAKLLSSNNSTQYSQYQLKTKISYLNVFHGCKGTLERRKKKKTVLFITISNCSPALIQVITVLIIA